MLEAIVGVTVTIDMLERASDATERERDLPDQSPIEVVLLREFNDDKLEPVVFVALTLRILALDRLITERAMDRWSIRIAGRKHILVRRAFLEAASQARLVAVDNDFGFDPSEFLGLALVHAASEGWAL